MFVSDFEISNQPELKEKLKTWAANLNLAAKSAGASTFAVNGPQMLAVRARSSSKRVGSNTLVHRNFMGGEKFRLASVVLNTDTARRGREVLVIMTPAELALASEITTLSLPLDRALEVFEGLEEWTKASGIESDSARAARIADANAVKALPTVEEVRASDAWGGW